MKTIKKEIKKKITQVKVFSLIETPSGEAMLNGFLRSNKVVNISTNVHDGHVSAIVIYSLDIVDTIEEMVEEELEKVEVLEDIEFPEGLELKKGGV